MFVLFFKILENAVPLATGQVLAELPKFKPDFLVDVQSTPCLPHKILQPLFYQSPRDDTNTQEKSKTRVMQNVGR